MEQRCHPLFIRWHTWLTLLSNTVARMIVWTPSLRTPKATSASGRVRPLPPVQRARPPRLEGCAMFSAASYDPDTLDVLTRAFN